MDRLIDWWYVPVETDDDEEGKEEHSDPNSDVVDLEHGAGSFAIFPDLLNIKRI